MNSETQQIRLVRYTREGLPASVGIVVGENILDLQHAGQASSMEDVIARWGELKQRLTELSFSEVRMPSAKLAEVTLHAPVPMSGTLYCAGANYRDHVAEMALVRGTAPAADDPEPWHFIKPTRACLVGPGAVKRPNGCRRLDWEAELAVVIGHTARAVSVEDALSYVACYTVANDLSARDLFTRAARAPGSAFYFDWIGQKGFDGSCPIGPWMTGATGINPQNLRIRLSVNGVIKQDSSTSEMIFSVAEQIAQISLRTTLFPGDIILTGTPAGVGSGRNEFLAPGDRVSVEVQGLGELLTTIVETTEEGA